MREAEILSKVDELIRSFDNMSASIDKALNRKLVTVYGIMMRLASMALLTASVVAGLYGYGFSALVLGSMFLIFWFIDRISVAIVGGFRGYAEGKTRELELEKEKYIHKT